jgi:growth hormone-inducible transmembrane protein
MSVGKSIAFGGGAASICGLTYLSYLGHKERISTPPLMRMHLFNPKVQERIRNTFGYFSAACMGTGAFMYLFRNSKLVFMNEWLLFACSLGMMAGTIVCDYQTNWLVKNMFYAGFIGVTSAAMLPLIHKYSMPVICDALIATGFTVGGLTAVAYNAPSEQFLNWGGPLALGLGGICGVCLLRILYPNSAALYNINLYGGLVLFSAYLMYDIQEIINRAKTKMRYDPIYESLGIYLDVVNLFTDFVEIFGKEKK